MECPVAEMCLALPQLFSKAFPPEKISPPFIFRQIILLVFRALGGAAQASSILKTKQGWPWLYLDEKSSWNLRVLTQAGNDKPLLECLENSTGLL